MIKSHLMGGGNGKAQQRGVFSPPPQDSWAEQGTPSSHRPSLTRGFPAAQSLTGGGEASKGAEQHSTPVTWFLHLSLPAWLPPSTSCSSPQTRVFLRRPPSRQGCLQRPRGSMPGSSSLLPGHRVPLSRGVRAAQVGMKESITLRQFCHFENPPPNSAARPHKASRMVGGRCSSPPTQAQDAGPETLQSFCLSGCGGVCILPGPTKFCCFPHQSRQLQGIKLSNHQLLYEPQFFLSQDVRSGVFLRQGGAPGPGVWPWEFWASASFFSPSSASLLGCNVSRGDLRLDPPPLQLVWGKGWHRLLSPTPCILSSEWAPHLPSDWSPPYMPPTPCSASPTAPPSV